MAKKEQYKYGYLYGNKGRRKNRSLWFQDEFTRNLHARADADNGFARIRKFKKKVI